MSNYSQFLAKEQEYGLPAGYLSRTAQIESGGDPRAANPNSSAKGLFQFIDSTAAQYGLADPYDPVASTDAAARLAADNAAYLRRTLGRDPSAGELYLAHQQGAGGAARLLSNPDASAASIVGDAAASLNRGGGKTAGQLASEWTGKFDGAGGGSDMIGGAGDTMAYGNPAEDQITMAETEGGLGGLGGFLNSGNGGDLLQAIGYSLMGSDRRTPLAEVGTYLPALQDRRLKRDLIADEKAKENKTLSFLRQSYPEIAQQVDAGLPVADAFRLAQTERMAKEKGPEYTASQRDFMYAQQNPEYLDFLNKSGSGTMPTATREIEDRARLAPQYGLSPDSAEGKAFILTGKLPSAERNVTAGDRAAIREADDMVFSSDQAAQTLQTALGLSDGAYEGATAGTRAAIGNNLPDWLVPDVIASPEGSANTSRLNQAVTEGALQQMKSIFGGNPTEGERQILLDIQGSAAQPKAVREAIYARAQSAIERRKAFNQDRANELRGNTYYDPRTAPAPAAGASAGDAPATAAPAAADPLGLR